MHGTPLSQQVEECDTPLLPGAVCSQQSKGKYDNKSNNVQGRVCITPGMFVFGKSAANTLVRRVLFSDNRLCTTISSTIRQKYSIPKQNVSEVPVQPQPRLGCLCVEKHDHHEERWSVFGMNRQMHRCCEKSPVFAWACCRRLWSLSRRFGVLIHADADGKHIVNRCVMPQSALEMAANVQLPKVHAPHGT